MVGELYGVPLRGSVSVGSSGGPMAVEFAAKPSPELLEHIAALPRGSAVAIDEYRPEDLRLMRKVMIGGHTNNVKKDKYYDPILDLCEEKGLRVVYLQDAKIGMRCGEFVVASDVLRAKMGDLEEVIGDLNHEVQLGAQELLSQHTEALKQYTELVRESEMNTTRFNYFYVVHRMDNMLATVSREQPAVTVMSWDYAMSAFLLRQDLFSTYSREVFPIGWLQEMVKGFEKKGGKVITFKKYCEERLPRNTLITTFDIDSGDPLDYEPKRRAYFALNGPICDVESDGESVQKMRPDWNGHFDWPEDKFEVYVDGKRFDFYYGRMIRPNSVNRFVASFTDDTMEMRVRMPTLDDEHKQMVMIGKRQGDGYVGKAHHPRMKHSFELRPCDFAKV